MAQVRFSFLFLEKGRNKSFAYIRLQKKRGLKEMINVRFWMLSEQQKANETKIQDLIHLLKSKMNE